MAIFNKRFRFGLLAKFIPIGIIIILLIAVMLSLFFLSQQRTILTDGLKKRGIALTRNLAYNSEYGVITEDEVILSQLIEGTIKHEDISYAVVFNKEGKVLAASSEDGIFRQFPGEGSLKNDDVNIQSQVLEGIGPVFDITVSVLVQEEIKLEDEDWFVRGIQEEDTSTSKAKYKEKAAIGVVRVGISLKSTNAAINRNRNLSTSVIAFASITSGIFFSMLLVMFIIRPLRKFVHGANAIRLGYFNLQIDINRTDEIGILAESFNAMIKELKEKKEMLEASSKKLKEYSESLEHIVELRTHELEGKTVELKSANIRLQEADRLKSIFLASMSHELRTPLNSIIGFTGIILQGMSGEVNEEQKKQLTMVKNSASHLLSLINDLLDISKIEAGKVELSLEEFRLDDVMRETVETFMPKVKEKGVELLADFSEGLPLFSDKRRVKQILMNLVSNAVKFTDQGSVKIASRILKDKILEMRVTDTGIGIKKESMNKLFMPFQQIDSSLTKSHEGTGLGLHLSKKLVALLGGNISAKSRHNKGSEFTFTLPLKYEEEKRNEKDTGG